MSKSQKRILIIGLALCCLTPSIVMTAVAMFVWLQDPASPLAEYHRARVVNELLQLGLAGLVMVLGFLYLTEKIRDAGWRDLGIDPKSMRPPKSKKDVQWPSL